MVYETLLIKLSCVVNFKCDNKSLTPKQNMYVHHFLPEPVSIFSSAVSANFTNKIKGSSR